MYNNSFIHTKNTQLTTLEKVIYKTDICSFHVNVQHKAAGTNKPYIVLFIVYVN